METKTTGTTVTQTVAYRGPDSRSRRLYERACDVMPGGNSRHSIALAPYPVYALGGKGCRLIDADGEERIDFINNYTALILGHANDRVVKAVTSRIASGTCFNQPTRHDVELAELIVERVPYVDQLRFCNSGSEAVLLAVKAARAYTGRPKVAKFEGAYHGIYDYVQVSEGPTAENWGDPDAPASVLEASSPASVASDVVVMPWNNLHACRELIRQHGAELAGVVVDPLPAGLGMIAPAAGFLEMLREETARHGALLISDEVMSFRVHYHGALFEAGITPDVTSFGKIIGGGFPVGAVGGTKKVMQVFDHTGDWKVHHGGTFNANPVTMVAGLETMKQMTIEAYERLNALGDYLRARLTRMFRDSGTPAQVCGKGSLFTAHLTDRPVTDFRSLVGFSRTNPVYAGLCHEMLANGIVTSSRGVFGCLSTPMTEAECDAFVNAVATSLATLRERS
jgi:glutamate-1-semialdehyde 2,1-aminomutase